MAEDFSAVTKQLIEDRKLRQAELEVQKNLLEKMGKELESAGMKAEDNAEYNKKSLELDKQQLKFRLKGADSPSARKEIKSEQAAAAKKNQNLLGKIASGVTGMFGKMGEKVKGAGKGIWAILKGTLVAGLMIALLAFLESDTWKSMKETIVTKLIPKLKTFYKDTLKPFVTGILDFIKDPSWENFKKIFDVKDPMGLVMGLAGLTALLAPGVLFLGLKLGIKAFGKSLSLLGSGLSAMIPGGGGAAAMPLGKDGKPLKGAALKSKLAKQAKMKPPKASLKGAGVLAKVGLKGIVRGAATAAKFVPGLGLAVTGIMGLFDGITAGMREAKKESSTKLTIMKAATAGVISGLTFGLVEQKTIENALSGMGDNLVKFTNWIYTPGEGSPGGTTSAKLFGVSLGFPDIGSMLKAGWDKLGNFFTGIAKWIYTPGAAATMGGGGTPAKLFGVELKFPSLNISFGGMADKILSILPRWLTDPAGYIKGLVTDMASILPGMGGDKDASTMSPEEKAKAIEAIKEEMATSKKSILQSNVELGKTGFAKHGPTQRKRYLDMLAADQAKLGEQEKRLYVLSRQTGGPVTKGRPYLVGEGTTQGELFIPDSSGMILSAQRTEQIMQAGLQRGAAAGGGGAPAVVNAPVNTINNSQSNTTVTSTELKHPSAILNRVNLAA